MAVRAMKISRRRVNAGRHHSTLKASLSTSASVTTACSHTTSSSVCNLGQSAILKQRSAITTQATLHGCVVHRLARLGNVPDVSTARLIDHLIHVDLRQPCSATTVIKLQLVWNWVHAQRRMAAHHLFVSIILQTTTDSELALTCERPFPVDGSASATTPRDCTCTCMCQEAAAHAGVNTNARNVLGECRAGHGIAINFNAPHGIAAAVALPQCAGSSE